MFVHLSFFCEKLAYSAATTNVPFRQTLKKYKEEWVIFILCVSDVE